MTASAEAAALATAPSSSPRLCLGLCPRVWCWAALILGGVANVVLLAAPAWLIAGPVAFLDPPLWLFLFLATGLYLADAWKLTSRAPSRDATPSRRERALSMLTGLLLLAVFVVAVGERSAGIVFAAEGVWATVRIALGGVAMLAGVALRAFAVATLGPAFQTAVVRLPGRALVRVGPYRYLRHPGEAALILSACGAALLLGGGVSLLTSVLLALVIAYRTRLEDVELHRLYGARYQQYAREAGGLAPRLF